MKHNQKESDKDIAMATNQAYETVEVNTRQDGAGKQDRELREKDEVIYETPADV